MPNRSQVVFDRIEQRVDDIKVAVTQRIYELLIPATPILTGATRASYRQSYNQPDPTHEPIYGDRKINDPRYTIPPFSLQPTGDLGDKYIVSNSIPYFSFLNIDGISNQAEPMFVQRAVGRAVRTYSQTLTLNQLNRAAGI